MENDPVQFALSIKQPWAALVVHGLKTIEVRRWPTARRGHLLIHAARLPDERPDAWKHVPPKLLDTAQLTGGIIGSVNLTDCVEYRTLDRFVADQAKHRNEPAWYEPPLLFGFVMSDPVVLPYRAYPGWFRFFKVNETTPKRAQK